jgi:hypothetical protein
MLDRLTLAELAGLIFGTKCSCSLFVWFIILFKECDCFFFFDDC